MQPPKAADASDAGERPPSAPEPTGERAEPTPEPAGKRLPRTPEPAEEHAPNAPARAGAVRAEGPAAATASTSGHLTGSTLASAEAALSDRVSGDEPLLPARVHRPSDLMRLLIGIAAIAVLFAIAAFAQGTTTGLEDDISKGTEQAPDLLIKIAGLVSSIAVLLVPVAFAIERLIKRDGLRIADGVLAAVLAHGVTLATDLWVSRSAPGTIQEALTQPQPGAGLTDPVHGYLAPVIAYMTAVGMARRPRWRVVLWAVLLLDAFAMLVGGYTTPFSIILTVLIGWTVAYGTLYAVGSPNVRPTGQHLMAGLRHVGFRPVAAMRTEDAPDNDNTDQNDRGRRYLVTLEDGPPLDVTVVDREQQAQGFFYRAWRRLTLRTLTQRRSIQSLRQALEQEALLAYAAIAAGANAPKLIATSELGPDAVMLVYEHIGGRSLDQMEDEEITDDLVRGAWRQVKALQSRRIAHRRLTGDALLVDRSGKVFVTDLRGGEIAAGDLVLRMDVAQLLTTLGLRVGAERSVAGALAVLGPDAVADCLPLLQPIALSRSTRATLRRLARERSQQERDAVLEASRAAKEARARDAAEKAAQAGAEAQAEPRSGHKAERKSLRTEKQAEKRAVDDAMEEAREGDLLAQIRRQVLLIRPQAPVEPVRLERIKPRTLFSFIAGAIAAYFLISQVTQADFGVLVEQAEWGWVAAALGFSGLSYIAAAMSLLGFVPERVPFLKTVQAQVAGSFVKIVAPAAVGGVALNTRFLQRAGVRPGLAVASVGASQLFGLGCHILLLALFGYLTGTEKTPDSLTPSRTVIAGLLTVAVLVLVVTAIPFLRKFVVTRVRSLFAGVVPRMLDVVQRPQKLVTGIGGMLLLTGLFVLCLDASIRAFSGPDVTQLSYASIAVVFLAGNALGSAAPTPGGMGAVEGALTLGLIAVGLPMEVAAPAVLLYRVMTLWLPVLPGWIAFNQLTRKGEL
ncbi:lysylphosphatidylglycerol synthase domain-containing protein [Streptomyces cyaneofuscatus]|uniref:Lysylphosphatidylglycerol synthase domain-containing protein n=1 Tax=Streptomyces cyaneofuscatus TaxID=66883 RepID=A0ABZ1F1S6_9ACTN|nr:lysylphosphatidylglycerol synthase domain-containing protein [Streptomyces cyaneofuscatus]WSB10229.1 lysylphosphatidylglycerol synthase domain-containing protein [Streptomyces cyaneofuscatus]WSD46238.1 lysylphosphatidylglycerol synthase domain-containing protein [Streptomyces cyaneofuscatus]WTA89614.1 lysylphosphatidylglycerol synthase domain-containing protein [Streptomyces cyaneofuscatus]